MVHHEHVSIATCDVNGVDDNRHSGTPTNDPPVDTRLGIVGMQDRRAFAPQHLPQLTGCTEIGEQIRQEDGVRAACDALEELLPDAVRTES